LVKRVFHFCLTIKKGGFAEDRDTLSTSLPFPEPRVLP
jgi:hypothetical protein